MILFFDNGQQIPGSVIRESVFRSDCSPVPLTLEVELSAGDSCFEKLTQEGRTLRSGTGDDFHIVKSERVNSREVQGESERASIRIVALLKACLPIAYVRQRAIIKERAALSAIYRAAGSTIRSVDADFPVPRFYCPIGETPSYHIARILQEEGGIVRWKNHRLQFLRLPDIFRQSPALTVAEANTADIDGGFLERHEVPWFFSLNESAGFVFGNRSKARAVRFAPFKNTQRLRNLTRTLVQRKTLNTTLNFSIAAGDVVEVLGNGRFAIVTAAHVFRSGTEGEEPTTYTRLWLASLED